MNKYAVSIAWVVGILLFFLPFVEVKCNATPLYEAKGIDLVTGFTVKDNPDKNSLDNLDVNDVRNERQEGNGFAIAAFILGIAGLILSFMNFKSQPVVSSITGVLAALCLIALMIQVKADVGKWSNHPRPNSDNVFFDDMSRSMKITAEFTTWFYLSLISFLVAAYLSYKNKPSAVVAQQPPKDAPQVPIQNPGEQSEFPTSASESEIG
jgi:hypothetical protein